MLCFGGYFWCAHLERIEEILSRLWVLSWFHFLSCAIWFVYWTSLPPVWLCVQLMIYSSSGVLENGSNLEIRKLNLFVCLSVIHTLLLTALQLHLYLSGRILMRTSGGRAHLGTRGEHLDLGLSECRIMTK